jgi:hypothetical protein
MYDVDTSDKETVRTSVSTQLRASMMATSAPIVNPEDRPR